VTVDLRIARDDGWDDFRAHVIIEDGAKVVHLTGELDLLAVPKIAPASLSTGDVAVVFDLTEMSFMDWYGYRSILVARRSLLERGGSLTLCNLVGRPAYALDVFDRLGMAA